MNQSADLPLARGFPDASRDEWIALVEKVLKGASFDKKLVSRTYDGIEIPPVYSRADCAARVADGPGLPGAAPWVRGSRSEGSVATGWDVRQAQDHPDPERANQSIHKDLERGGSSVLLRFAGSANAHTSAGLIACGAQDLARILEGVDLARVPVAMESGADFLVLAAALMALWERVDVAPGSARGAFNADPLAVLASEGSLPADSQQMLSRAADLAVHTSARFPHVTSIGVDSGPYHHAGCTEAQELACSMATAVSYLRAVTAAGLDVDSAARQFAFTFTVSSDQFPSIAKLRAARRLWGRITEVAGVSEAARAMRLHASSSARNMSTRDPWVNMLRTTVACFSAGVGGADSVTMRPFNEASGIPDDFARRIARNTQVILQEESAIGRVIDPAGGSWYVESLTSELAAHAWSLFQEIESAGGMVQALADGRIAQMIEHAWLERSRNVARRRDAITGVSEFPDLAEESVSVEQVDVGALRRAAAERASPAGDDARAVLQRLADTDTAGTNVFTELVLEAIGAGADFAAVEGALSRDGVNIEPLPRHRLGEAFEALRDASDAWQAAHGARPKVYLARLGTPAQYVARATFAKNFFAAGGIEAVQGEATAEAFGESDAQIAVLCSADDVYAEHAAQSASALQAAGATQVFLAGRPGEAEQAYRDGGVNEFIYLGADVLGILRSTLGRLGVLQS